MIHQYLIIFCYTPMKFSRYEVYLKHLYNISVIVLVDLMNI